MCLSAIAQCYAWTLEYITLAIQHCFASYLSHFDFKQSSDDFLLSPHVMFTVLDMQTMTLWLICSRLSITISTIHKMYDNKNTFITVECLKCFIIVRTIFLCVNKIAFAFEASLSIGIYLSQTSMILCKIRLTFAATPLT